MEEKIRIDPRKDDVSLLLSKMDRYFTEMLKSKKKSLEYLVRIGVVTKEDAEKRIKEEKLT